LSLIAEPAGPAHCGRWQSRMASRLTLGAEGRTRSVSRDLPQRLLEYVAGLAARNRGIGSGYVETAAVYKT
jgi:hypothetical protein